MNINILIVGVGGQGTLLASRILGSFAHMEGKECKLSEVHGMSQRGGSVVTHVRIGDRVFSPLVSEGEADIVLAFEKLEALRWRHYLKKDGLLIVNDQEIMPMPVIIGKQDYPENLSERIKAAAGKSVLLNAYKIAVSVGQPKAANVVLVGSLFKEMGISPEEGLKALEAEVKPRFLEDNKKAFAKGYGQ